DANLSPSGPPSATQPNDPAQIDLLPVDALHVIAEPPAIETPEMFPTDDPCDMLLEDIIHEYRDAIGDVAAPAEVKKALENHIKDLQLREEKSPAQIEDLQNLQVALDDLEKCFP